MEEKKTLVENIKYNCVDSTGMLAGSHPLYSLLETKITGMSNEVSINSRIYITVLSYMGLGWLIGKGRDLSKKLFKITEKTKERFQTLHDSLYMMAISIPLGIGIYTAAGETDIKKIAVGTGMAMAYNAALGPWTGLTIDIARDLAGMKECKRKIYPNFLKRLKPKMKKAVAGALVAASIGLMSLVYVFNSDKPEPVQDQQTIEQTVQGNYLPAPKTLESTISE